MNPHSVQPVAGSEGLIWILGKFPYGKGSKTASVGSGGFPWKCGKKNQTNMDVACGTGSVVLGDAWSFPVLTIP